MSKSQKLERKLQGWKHKTIKLFTCCLSEQKDVELVDGTCQHELVIDSNSQQLLENVEEISAQASLTDIFSEEVVHPYAEDFKISMQKLDHLINVLNNVYGICQQNQRHSNQSESTQVEKLVASPEHNEGFTFNVNIKEDNLVQCHTKKGKFSLKIIDTAKGRSKFNPFGLHRCSPTLEIARDFSKKDLTKIIRNCSLKSKKISSDLDVRKGFQLHRSFHTLPSDLGEFGRSLLEHILTIKTEVQGLKHVFGNAECHWESSDASRISFKISDISKWIAQKQVDFNNCLLSPDDLKFMNSRKRASTFCQFYKMVKAPKNKKKKKAIKK